MNKKKLPFVGQQRQKERLVSGVCLYVRTSSLPGFLGGVVVKNPTAHAGDERDVGLIPRSGRSPGEKNGTPVHYSCLENSMDRGALVGCSR